MDFFFNKQANCQFTGVLDQAIRYIEDFQLLDAENWARFVHQFRIRPDAEDRGWRGEYWGKMMRGAAFTYAYTQNPALYKALTDTVEDMLTTQDEWGRIASYPQDREFQGWDLWCRKYVLLGMQYFAEVCTDADLIRRMVDSMKRQADYLIDHLGPAEDGKLPITEASHCWRGLNSSSILEPIVRLYNLTQEQQYLDFASYIVGEGGTSICNIFEMAFEDTTDPYQYPVTKAYEMMSCFEGLLEYYRATGIDKHREAVIRFAHRVMDSDITIIGSAGCTHELFDHSAARQADTAYEGIMQETCVTVTWMKFCWQLLRLTGDPVFADRFEQALYNAYLGAVNTEKVVDTELIARLYPTAKPIALPFDSYSCLTPNTRGRGIGGLKLMPDDHYYGCCACIGSAGTGLIGKVAAMPSADGWAINLFAPGTIDLGDIVLKTETDYPIGGKVVMSISAKQNTAFTLRIRIPAWSLETALTVNGQAYEVTPGYTALTREWADGDKIELTLDMHAQVIHAPRNPRDLIMTGRSWKHDVSFPLVVEESADARYHIALRRGPLVLARDARLGEDILDPVSVAYDADGYVNLVPSAKAGFATLGEWQVPQKAGEPFTMIDYASAGKTWREIYGCWIPTKEDESR